jgi:hypothetical protein
LYPTSTSVGPVSSRQDGSYSHHVILDPSRRFVLVPDLGADLVRVFAYDPDAAAPLVERAPLETDAGAGPRHGVFWRAPGRSKEEWFLLFNGELSQKVYSYRVAYAEGGLAWEKVDEVTALGEVGDTLGPNQAPTSELAVSVSLPLSWFAASMGGWSWRGLVLTKIARSEVRHREQSPALVQSEPAVSEGR